MWPFCEMTSPLWLLLPFLIGLLTGWWAWANRPRVGVEAARPVAAPEPVRLAEPVAEPPAPVAAAPVAASPVAAALTAIGIPAAVGAADDLQKINGIGPALNELLNSLGVTRFDQIAAWTADDVDKVDDHLGAFKNRIGRDEWVEQARLLASGQFDEWKARYNYLKGE